ncbi:LacI family transcriptional regulator [Mycetocola manganoxydans]|uniref:LacI family transcriptional regulator n=1 Tax=Mycetocola manganoxydans TaxID=699879 RepID=A0A3L6ZKE8_9MICO|nr:LacI family DNA-binding transcriptional regulator [Mycetocola manganoxydans]RLP68474.1 LacI family transcriptional regulator [Mycetocola manganoxydans]GHD52191.1 LacI family transcriptional regulator [Mycetocola manganoxydans]
MVDVDPKVKLAQLAEDAGVSLSTVSKVLNGRPDVSARTRAKVEAILDAQGYQRRAGLPGRGTLIELVFPELETAWAMEIIRGVENVARAHGLSIVLTESGDRHSPSASWIDGVLRRRPVGVVLVFSDLADEAKAKLRSRAIPFVIIDPAGDPASDVPSVGSANWAGGLAATRHLIELGHTRIAAITGRDDMMCSFARVDGYRSAMNSAGIEVDERFVRFGNFQVDGGRNIALELLDAPDRPTAIFAGSDLQALGVIEAARTLGLRVPDDLSIVGYDDLQLAKWSSPALTTVHQPLTAMAEEAARLVIRMSDSPLGSIPRMDLATRLVVRESSAPPAGA